MGKMGNKRLKDTVKVNEVSKALRLKQKELSELEREGVFQFEDVKKSKISLENFNRLKMAVTLMRDLDVNVAGVDIILNMRDRMNAMRKEFEALSKKSNRR